MTNRQDRRLARPKVARRVAHKEVRHESEGRSGWVRRTGTPLRGSSQVAHVGPGPSDGSEASDERVLSNDKGVYAAYIPMSSDGSWFFTAHACLRYTYGVGRSREGGGANVYDTAVR